MVLFLLIAHFSDNSYVCTFGEDFKIRFFFKVRFKLFLQLGVIYRGWALTSITPRLQQGAVVRLRVGCQPLRNKTQREKKKDAFFLLLLHSFVRCSGSVSGN